jgi:hypothetical protein
MIERTGAEDGPHIQSASNRSITSSLVLSILHDRHTLVTTRRIQCKLRNQILLTTTEKPNPIYSLLLLLSCSPLKEFVSLSSWTAALALLILSLPLPERLESLELPESL